MIDKKTTIILASRNDDYGKSPQTRLNNTLNFLLNLIYSLDLENLFDVLILDYDSTSPLKEVCPNDPILNYLSIPKKELEFEKNLFPESRIFNIGVLNSSSNNFLKIDQDIIIGSNFFDFILDTAKLPDIGFSGCRYIGNNSFFIEKDFYLKNSRFNYPLFQPDRCYNIFKRNNILPFYSTYKGVLFFKKTLFQNLNGFNKELIYQNYINIDFINRASIHYPIYNLGLKTNFDFYHQRHNMKDNKDRLENSYKNLSRINLNKN